VIGAGASRVVVVRAIRDADDPRAAAAALREALEEASVGAES
jgi:thiamine-phosphate pyrophosphorylase